MPLDRLLQLHVPKPGGARGPVLVLDRSFTVFGPAYYPHGMGFYYDAIDEVSSETVINVVNLIGDNSLELLGSGGIDGRGGYKPMVWIGPESLTIDGIAYAVGDVLTNTVPAAAYWRMVIINGRGPDEDQIITFKAQGTFQRLPSLKRNPNWRIDPTTVKFDPALPTEAAENRSLAGRQCVPYWSVNEVNDSGPYRPLVLLRGGTADNVNVWCEVLSNLATFETVTLNIAAGSQVPERTTSLRVRSDPRFYDPHAAVIFDKDRFGVPLAWLVVGVVENGAFMELSLESIIL